ncbi:MAG: DUF4157 domain-containing protein [Kordia sp.]|uniref:eCIS core domain-containing protein n=1 Tax=Kordia sp. TaxID=1965332 RepID=UPI00385C6F34
MKTKKQSDKKEKTSPVIQRKDKNSFVKSKADSDSFTPPTNTGQNKGLPSGLQSNMESSLGQDFSNVSIHTNSQEAIQMNARAYTQGEQVHFAPGEFNPNSSQGKNLIGHEFTHVAQQRSGVVKPTKVLQKGVAVNDSKHLEQEADSFGQKAANGETVSKYRGAKASSSSAVQTKDINAPIQRLIKSPYPWTGRVENAILLALRDGPDGNTLADLPDNTVVTVLANSSGWLQIQVDTSQAGIILNTQGQSQLSGTMLTGYSGHRYINDATVSAMSEMVGHQEWDNPTATDFYQYFVVGGGSGTLPDTATMNCWESIMYAAYVTDQIDTAWISAFYGAALATPRPTASVWTALGWYSALPMATSSGGAAPAPNIGDLIYYTPSGGAMPDHVALYVGNGEVISLWEEPNGINSVQRISITALSGDIQFNPPPW